MQRSASSICVALEGNVPFYFINLAFQCSHRVRHAGQTGVKLSNIIPKSDQSDFSSLNTTAKLAMSLVSVSLGEPGWLELKVILVSALRPRVKISHCLTSVRHLTIGAVFKGLAAYVSVFRLNRALLNIARSPSCHLGRVTFDIIVDQVTVFYSSFSDFWVCHISSPIFISIRMTEKKKIRIV